MSYKWLFQSLTAGCLVLATGCVAPSVTLNKMYPQNRQYAPKELATLVVAPPMEIDSLDGQKIQEVGDYSTVIKMLPGEHTIDFHVDTSASSDRLLGSGKTIMTSGSVAGRFQAQPGWLHVLRIDRTIEAYGHGKARGTITSGINPLRTEDGHMINVDLEKWKINAQKGAIRKEYELYPSEIYYSPDGRHLAFWTRDRKRYYVRDGVEEQTISAMHQIGAVWSLDGSHFAYGVVEGLNKLYIILDGKRLGPYNIIVLGTEFFFDQEGRLIYGVSQDDGWYMMRGQEAIKMAGETDVHQAIEKAWEDNRKALGSQH